MTVTSLCVLSCKFFGSFAVHSSKHPTPHPSTLQKKKERKKSVSCEFRMSFSFTASCFTCPARCFSCKQKTGRLEQQRWDTAQCFTLSFKEENCCFECSVWWVRVQMHWESSGCYSESFQDPLFSLPPPRPPLSLFFPGIFTLGRAAPGAIHYCVKVLVLRFGLEAQWNSLFSFQ